MNRRTLLFCTAGVLAKAQDRRAVILERARILSVFPGQQIAEATPELLDRAAKIARGTVFFYNRTPVEVGLKDIDWTGAHIRHQEWPAQLNRFYYLGPLASAYRATHDESFARAARAYIEDWMRGDSYASSSSLRAGDNTLTMSIRLGTSFHAGWAGVLPVFLESPSFDDAFLNKVFTSISAQADFLSRHLTAFGNWRISQLDALVFTAVRFPFLENAPRLREAGIAGMRAA
ncbi:MAG: heparinase II/III family protein, partial [Bryobacteraceae bacterium]